MIKHIWTVLCRKSTIDSETNNISLEDTYENLRFDLQVDEKTYDKTKPFVGPFEFEVVSLFYRDKKGTAESHDVILKILDPKGVALGEFNATMAFEEHHNRMRNRMRFNTIAVTTSGTYIFQVILKRGGDKQDLVASLPVDITVIVNGKEL